uniref:CrtB n=1 Tax=Streptomyces griseus TaxID=1911 RepID=Q9EXK9_STRGR|nr:CrtB [Streptomyces griseus subsp. griseus NBRC 13350]
MTVRELDAAGIHDPALRAAYTRCRVLNARHGRTYFLATRLLPVDRRPAVHALYGFARRADDIVDDLDSSATPGERARALLDLEARLEAGLRGAPAAEPVIRALADTAGRYAIDHRHFTDFLRSMRSDLTVGGYASYEELGRYMHGSAAVIGLQMLPVLGTVVPREESAPHAAALGVAFQWINFLRDVGEDVDPERLYLATELLGAHRADRDRFESSRSTGMPDSRITDVLPAAAAHYRAVYRAALPGIAMLAPVSRPCIRTAFVLYSGILDAIEADGYALLHRPAVVPRRRPAAVPLDDLVPAVAVRTLCRRPAHAVDASRTAELSGPRTAGRPARVRTEAV